MKNLIKSIIIACLATFLPTSAFAATIIVAYDGTFLGVVDNNRYNSNSICNRYGQYGSRYGEYPNDLTWEQWELIADLFPEAIGWVILTLRWRNPKQAAIARHYEPVAYSEHLE
ncbi:MAG: hypothetical protein DSM106950_16350 [Stigonema ocellatum SAG 48.90 = DSM 106950]|nr:hypothetical protein [Stigonema ocellatum SAG 48.90 = DSM 106950]